MNAMSELAGSLSTIYEYILVHEKEPITPPNFGHGMLFQTLESKWLMSVHSHKDINGHYKRIPHLFEVDLSGNKLVIGKLYK